MASRFRSSLRTFHSLTAFAGVSLAIGCASTPAPPELLDARSAYLRAEQGAAAQYKPDQLHEAKVALDRAEKSYADDPREQKTRDLAYVAERRAEIADVQARDAKAAQEKVQAEHEAQRITTSQLSQTRAQLNAAGQQLAGATQQLAGTQIALETEKKARADADKRAREAMDKLAASAAGAVKQETRGTVITIPSGVLFTTGKSALLPAAQTKLQAVAEALKDQDDRKIVVEGHTDSQGSDESNQILSQARAQSVRDFLVSRGVPSERISAQGFGAGRPVADNKSVEGRANNRRVEIIVQTQEAK
ncbi:MAG TPA: OmpA family protein [Polyangiaceae bacterium]|nr:OmpA family protein [Polyangiaceae bacterium]